jgi:hypothetical protein
METKALTEAQKAIAKKAAAELKGIADLLSKMMHDVDAASAATKAQKSKK